MNKRILLIDDEAAILEVLQIVLEDEGYVISTLSTGEKILQTIETHSPDIILMDFSLPGEKGDSITKRLKSNKKTNTIPIIMISAHHALQQVATESRADAYLPKPFSIDHLLKVIEKVVINAN